jgi:hypothetical protein
MDKNNNAPLLEQIAALLAAKYVLPDTGEQVAGHLRQRLAEGDPLLGLPPVEFADALTQTFFTLTQDSHLRLDYDPEQAAGGGNTEDLMRRHFERARRGNFGFLRAERLAGNVGWLVIRELAPPEVAGEVAAGALAFVANSQALILDLRGNGGGTPEMVQFIISYLVEAGQPLSGIYARATGATEAFQTLAEIPGKRRPDVPVYVLVDSQTHSAAEALAYDLQALKRATLVGECTRGGAHPVEFIPLQDLFVLMLPVSRAVNPITGANWQGAGVIPDVAVPAEAALSAAHRLALEGLLASAKDDDEKKFLQAELKTL